MASSEWKIKEKMSRRQSFRALPESIEMTYIEEEGIVQVDEGEEEEGEEEGEEEEGEESEEEESEGEEEESEEEGELGSNFYGDMLEDFEIYFDRDKYRFMEKFSKITNRRNASTTIYCLSQHYELNYANYSDLYFLTLSAPIEELKKKIDDVNVISCSCPFFENNGNLPCKHMLLFVILYADFRAVRRSTRYTKAIDRFNPSS